MDGAQRRLGFPLLVHRNRRLGFDARRIRERGGPVLCETLVNTIWSLSLQALDGRRRRRPWSSASGTSDAGSSSTRPSPAAPGPASSPGQRSRPSRCPTCRRRSAGAWSRSTCSTEREFLTPVAPPSVAASEPSYEPGGSRGPVRRYWRGPTWVNSAWLVWLGLRRLGYEEAAARMANGVIGAVEREGLREYYDPRTGAGLGAEDFAWSALVAELAAT